MDSLLTREIDATCARESALYDKIVGLVADLVEQHLSYKSRRYITVKKPNLDVDKWIRRQLKLETYRQMELELTAQLLGTKNFTQIA